jgi:hypothetical protein
VEWGLPAVIGMQFEITDEAAITFAERIYTALAQSFPVDAALAQARKAIFAAGNATEFGTPVLFLRAAEARLFEPERPGDGATTDLEGVPEPKPIPPTPPSEGTITALGKDWERRHSLWIGWTFTLGFLNWIGFLYAGIRAKKQAWVAWGGAFYSIPFILAMIFVDANAAVFDAVVVPLTFLSVLSGSCTPSASGRSTSGDLRSAKRDRSLGRDAAPKRTRRSAGRVSTKTRYKEKEVTLVGKSAFGHLTRSRVRASRAGPAARAGRRGAWPAVRGPRAAGSNPCPSRRKVGRSSAGS